MEHSEGWRTLEGMKKGRTLYLRSIYTSEAAITGYISIYIPRGDIIVPIIVPEHPDCKKPGYDMFLNRYSYWYRVVSAGKGGINKPHMLVRELGEMIHGDRAYFKDEFI